MSERVYYYDQTKIYLLKPLTFDIANETEPL